MPMLDLREDPPGLIPVRRRLARLRLNLENDAVFVPTTDPVGIRRADNLT